MNKNNISIKMPQTTPVVFWFIIICIGTFFFQSITTLPQGIDLLTLRLGLIPREVWHSFQIWRLVTYTLLHGGIFHLAINLFVFWMIGSELEKFWGSREFLKYILIGGVGAGILHVLFQFQSTIPVIGASGVVFAVLLAFGMVFPNRTVYIYFLFPLKARYLVLLLGGLELLMLFSSGMETGIAHLAHLGGMLFGFIYLKVFSLKKQLKPVHKNDRNIHQVAPPKNRAYYYDDQTLKREMDRILLKLKIKGKHSLDAEELEILREASRRFGKVNHKKGIILVQIKYINFRTYE